MAEISNPFVIVRTLMKIKGLRGHSIYFINELIFAIIFIFVRVFLTPCIMIYMYEGDKILFTTKFGTSFILFVQLYWCYRILLLAAEAITGAFEKRGMKIPFWASLNKSLWETIIKNKSVAIGLSIFNFIWIIAIPHWYYGWVRGTLY
jgi:hypothetical protein